MALCPVCRKDNPADSAFCNSCGTKLPDLNSQMKCPYCGASGQEFQLACTKCGKDLPRGAKAAKFGSTSGFPTTTRACPNCGSEIPSDHQWCQYCGQRKWSNAYADSDHEEHAPSRNVTYGGVLILASGFLGIPAGIYALFISDVYSAAGYAGSGFITCCAVLIMLFSGVSVLGGLFAIQRRHFTLAVIGGV